MLALAKTHVVSDRAENMLKIGLGPLGKVLDHSLVLRYSEKRIQADLILARYTCVALQRLSGSAKKVKGIIHPYRLLSRRLSIISCLGSLADNNMRLEMGNPIFQKLKDAVEWQCRFKDWFGMAEQAINTIYALGEHPDVLCGDIIKALTRRIFAKPAPEQSQNTGSTVEDSSTQEKAAETPSNTQDSQISDDSTDAFDLSQLLFIVGHVAIKHLVFLELVEREWKRQKDEREKGRS